MAVMAHGTVGLQHAAMTIYNAFVARIPVFIILGNALDAEHAAAGRGVESQRPGRGRDGSRLHQVGRHADLTAAFCRVGRARLQDRDDACRWRRWCWWPTATCRKSRSRPIEAAHPEADADRPAGRRSRRGGRSRRSSLVAAENPVIVAGRAARTAEGMKLMVELAETLQAPVQGGGRNMPNRHPLSGGGAVAQCRRDSRPAGR